MGIAQYVCKLPKTYILFILSPEHILIYVKLRKLRRFVQFAQARAIAELAQRYLHYYKCTQILHNLGKLAHAGETYATIPYAIWENCAYLRNVAQHTLTSV